MLIHIHYTDTGEEIKFQSKDFIELMDERDEERTDLQRFESTIYNINQTPR